MDRRRLALLSLLFLAGFLSYRYRPRPAVVTLESGPMLRLRGGTESEGDRRALAQAVARRCGLAIQPDAAADPHLIWADLLPSAGAELAVATQITATGGLLALLAAEADGWRLVARLGPDELGVPTSLSAMTLPGRGGAVVLTDLADQLSGAFCRRETCTILVADHGTWRRLWTREIESEAYWSRAWDDPPGQGWLRLDGYARWRPASTRDGLLLSVAYRNTLAEAPGGERLPEAGQFSTAKRAEGREEYRWDPVLGLFVLGYGRTCADTPLLARRGMTLQPTATVLPAGQPVAILYDGAGMPASLLGGGGELEVLVPGRRGFLPPSAVRRLAGRPPDYPGPRQPWLLPRQAPR